MRILLDARDLINFAEHNIPAPLHDIGARLETGNHELVFSFTNIRELVSPLANGADFLEVRLVLQSLERMPHAYIKEVSIPGLEIQSALEAFANQTEYRCCQVYANRWDYTLMLPHRRPAAEALVNLRLDDIVYFVFRVSPQVFSAPNHHLGDLQRLFEQDRVMLLSGRAPARQHFANAVARHAHAFGMRLPAGREDEFARWVYANPDRCPGIRLNHEVYRALLSNYDDIPETADFSDLAHIFAIPYVDAATLDRRMRHYCGVASARLERLGAPDYRTRIYHNLVAILERDH